MVLITDGEDVDSRFRYVDALAATWEAEIPIFVLAVGSLARPFGTISQRARGFNPAGIAGDIIREQFRDLAEVSGGELIMAAAPGAVRDVFDEILARLRAYYLVTFMPSLALKATGRWYEVDVEVLRRGLSTFHAPRYYRSAADPRAARGFLRDGLIELEAGRVEDAIAHFERSSWADPAFVDAHYQTGRALIQEGRIDQALAAFLRASDRAPGIADSQIAQLSLQLGDFETAGRHGVQAQIAGHDMTHVFEQLRTRSATPADLQERLSVPRVLVPDVLVADPEARSMLDRLTRALRRAVWAETGLGLVHSEARAAYATKIVFDRLPDLDDPELEMQLEAYDRSGDRLFRRELSVPDVFDDGQLAGACAEAVKDLTTGLSNAR